MWEKKGPSWIGRCTANEGLHQLLPLVYEPVGWYDRLSAMGCQLTAMFAHSGISTNDQ